MSIGALRSGCRAGSATRRRRRTESASASRPPGGVGMPRGRQRPGAGLAGRAGTMRAVEHGLAGGLRRAVAVNVGIEGGGRKVQALGDFGCDRLMVRHCRHRHHQRGAIHLAWPPTHAPPRAGRGKPRHGALGDQLAFELGECGEDAECEASIGRRCVDLCARAGQHLQPDAPSAQVLDRVDQMAQVASEPIELPEHQRVAGLDRLQTGGQPRAGIVATGCQVLVDASGVYAGRQHRVPLRRQRLGAVRL